MKKLLKLTGLSAAILLFITSTQSWAQSSLADLLDAVENDRVAESEEYRARLQEFEQNAARQEQILEITEGRIVEQEELQVQLSDQFEANEVIIDRAFCDDPDKGYDRLFWRYGRAFSIFRIELDSSQLSRSPIL